jgi:hypothetical protein
MGLPYNEFKTKLLRALDPSLGARDRREAEDALAATLEDYPITESPNYVLSFLQDTFSELKDPLRRELAYAWSMPLLARMVLQRNLDATSVLDILDRIIRDQARELSPATWRQLAVALQNMQVAEALKLLRKVPAEEREKVLRDETLRAISA